MWDMTDLAEPQFATGVPLLFLTIGLINFAWLEWVLFSGK
jgi:hypothetical protein